MSTDLEPRGGRPTVRITTPQASLVAATTPVTVHTLSTGRTAILRKIMAYNGQAADVVLEIGTGLGVAFARSIPRIRLIAGFHGVIGELECPAFTFEANITAQASAAGAGALAVDVMLEAEEVG